MSTNPPTNPPADPPADCPGTRRDPDLHRRLRAALEAKGPGYRPRTRHLGPDGRPKYVNRLILEASPYLIQHAHNPVDWRPWGAGTLAEAQARDLPVFLSVGYATCHWCHVMEEESFDNEAVAQILNVHFIPVKVDREQHPAVDQVYITATQLQQGHAGWPNSLFLLPDGRPFHTGTYFPRPHFMQLLQSVAQLWRSGQRDEIGRVADQICAAIQRLAPAGVAAGPPPGDEVHAAAVAQLAEMHNPSEGGFSTTQQFPQEGFVLYLLDHWRRTGDSRALRVAGRALEGIAAGGIHDHVGGGFHRYTVDANWRTPHFEKMLYNQAQLARAFIEGWEATRNPAWRRAAERALAYVLRDMTDAEGAFHSAEDADSPDGSGERAEGAFYVWPPEAVRAALGAGAGWAIEALGLDQRPTVEDGPVAHFDPAEPPDLARLDPLLERLRAAREERPRPLRDDKVIAGWNGLMIRALAEAAVAFDEPAHAQAAARAAEALWSRHWTDGRLMRLWAAGRAGEDGVLEDYAWAGLGFLALWDATGAEPWRARAAGLARAALGRFADGSGRLRMAVAEGPVGPVYDTADGATPAGESAMLELLARLDRRLPDPDFRAEAERLIGALAGQLAQAPLLRPDALAAARILADGESGLRRALGKGMVRARMAPGGARLRLEIAAGWHVNAHDPGAEGLVGARLEGAAVDWPAGRARTLGFSDRPVRVYEGRLDLAPVPGADVARLTLQPCSDTTCLAPETAAFRLR
ncbi:MAG TPA: DUF255 domain-containing protein [Thermohalobaculum sp.]|nr:DUF255 domain-containing protein [Thermohalobaculum sp.]